MFHLLSSLSEEEYKLLHKAVRSPIWNTNEHLHTLYTQLKPFHPKFDLSEKHYYRVYDKIFKQQEYDDYKLRRLFSELTKVVEHFLIYLETLDSHKGRQKQRLLLRALGRRNVYPYFERGTLQVLDEVEAEPFLDVEHFQSLIGLHYGLYFHPLTNRHSKKNNHLHQLTESLDNYYVLAKLRIGSELKNREKMLNIRYKNRLEEVILGDVGEEMTNNSSVYQMYKLIYELFEEPATIDVFDELKQLFNQNITALRKPDQFFILHHLINFAARQINSGKTPFYKKALDLYKTGLSLGLLLENGRIREATYSNIILLGCQAGEFPWVDGFIEQYYSYLKEEIREDARAHALGLRYFYEKKFDQAVDQLSNYRFSPAYQPRVRIMIVRALFEEFLQDESIYNLLQAQCDAFEKYILRNDFLAKPRLEPHLNTMRLVRKLAQLLFDREPRATIHLWLTQELESDKKFISQNWLKEKSGQLVKENSA